MGVEAFTKLVQLSISPLALISGAALLLLSITNRLGRAIDRARTLIVEKETVQIEVLVRRAEFLRNSVFFTVFSIFLSTLMVLGLFLRLFMNWPLEGLILVFFFLSIVCLCLALVFLLLDVSLSLKALKVEVGQN